MIFTFYSFKGGVGRSMAVANIGELLFRRGLKVLLVDFDLEAPGLERYFDVNVEGRRGVIDMLQSYRELRAFSPPTPPEGQGGLAHSIEPLENFVTPIYGQNERGGKLALMPAGNRQDASYTDYAQRVLGFDWKDFYRNCEGEAYFDWFRATMDKQWDVTLVDSRTGVTEMGGVCTHQIADVVVSLVSTNFQNLEGAKAMASSLVNPELKARRRGRELKLLFVPARIELAETDKRDDFARKFNSAFEPLMAGLRWQTSAFVDLMLSYVPAYAFMETVAVREPARASNAGPIAEYARLATRMASLAIPSSELAKSYGQEAGDRYGLNAEEMYAWLDAKDRASMRELYSRLIPTGSLPAAEVDHVPAALIERLVDAKLVTGGQEIAPTDLAAARAWARAQEWAKEDQPLMEWRKGLNTLRQSWELAKRDRKYLLSGETLRMNGQVAGKYPNALNSAEREFVRASLAARSINKRAMIAAASVGALIALVTLIAVQKNLSLKHELQQASDRVIRVFVPNDSVPVEALRDLDSLRQEIDKMDQYLQHGPPVIYWPIWNFIDYQDLRKGAVYLYFGKFHDWLFTQAQASLMRALRTPGSEYSQTYEALKAYLVMTSQSDKSTKEFLTPVLFRYWMQNPPPDAESVALLKKQFDYYADRLKVANPYSKDSDIALVESVRKNLSQFPSKDRVYTMMLEGAKTNPSTPLNFGAGVLDFGGIVEIPGAFTKAGYAWMNSALANIGAYFGGEDWVLSGEAPGQTVDRPALAQEIRNQYVRDYAGKWSNLIINTKVLPFKGFSDAAAKLNVLAGAGSPLLAVFRAMALNTTVDDTGISQPFRAVSTVVGEGDKYMAGLASLQRQVAAAGASGQPSQDIVNQVADAVAQATATTQEIASGMSGDPVSNSVRRLVTSPVIYVGALPQMPADLNAKARTILRECGKLTLKYPFKNVTEEATADEVKSFFGQPDGALWVFYNAYLHDILTKNAGQYKALRAGVNPKFVDFFDRGAKISDQFFPNPGAFGFGYYLTPIVCPPPEGATLYLDGDSFQCKSGGQDSFHWSPGNTHTDALQAQGSAFQRSVGEWAVFRLFSTAQWSKRAEVYLVTWQPPYAPSETQVGVSKTDLLYPKFLGDLTCTDEILLK
jgi:hypothetical protein